MYSSRTKIPLFVMFIEPAITESSVVMAFSCKSFDGSTSTVNTSANRLSRNSARIRERKPLLLGASVVPITTTHPVISCSSSFAAAR